MSLSASRRSSASVALALPARFSSSTRRDQRLVDLVRPPDRADRAARRRAAGRARRLGRRSPRRRRRPRPGARGRGAPASGCPPSVAAAARGVGELDQVELVDGRHQPEELLLGHQLAGAGEAGGAVGRRADPRAGRQLARVDGAEEGLVRRVGRRPARRSAERRRNATAEPGVARAARATAWTRAGPGRACARGRALAAEITGGVIRRIQSKTVGSVDRRGDGDQRPLDQLPAPGPLLLGAELRVAGRVRDAPRRHDPRRADAHARSRPGCTAARSGFRRAPTPC